MSVSAFDGLDDNSFFDRVKAKFTEKAPDLSKTLNIAIIGKVSSGKSSLINALLQHSRRQGLEMAKVGAISGVTKDLTILKLDEKVCLIDSPGLDDIRAENSKVTRNFLKHIDVGVFVVTGSSDASQKKNLDDLRKHCDSIFVVLNKIDEWDDLDSTVLDEVINQWKNDLKVDKIYPTCAKGYDPKSRLPKMDIRGVYQLRKDIEEFLEKKGKDLLLARHMAEKKSYAVGIIAGALVAVAAEAFIPGSAVYITATQAVAIGSLYYLYKGQILPKTAAIAILPTFLSQTVGSNLFLVVKSFLPPTGIVDAAAAGVAVVITLAMLATVNSILSEGGKLEQEELLQSKFKTYHKQAKTLFKDLALTDINDFQSLTGIVTKFLS
ncbi:ferrous iron transport B family protein [Lyngbya aestuarii BL J]|uniref:Ferrous iron transport B family protein n=1 Tax=Lyngbya aestuarii BL J TaxID=1348334 RepID=U7QKT1_9CYAN|nr:GTPase [Lyngbya aestuarii]ERT08569.1 ferrous iron transport B family protein [Lyngbya aestuarii BL J]